MKFNRNKYPFVESGYQYALDVVAGRITACIYVIGACERYLRDIDRKDADWHFDPEAAEKFLRSVQKFEHVIGSWPSKTIHYEPWQNWAMGCIWGFRNKKTGFRRFRFAHLEVARGNAKSAMASQAALYDLALDSPNGNQISTVATKKDQARIVLDSSIAMARKSHSYRNHTGVKVLAHSIIHTKSNSKMRALSSEHSGLDGLNDILAVCDELHAMKRDTFEVITSGMSKRSDSLVLCITTAGSDVESVGHSQSAYAKKVCLGEYHDDTFFAAIYTLDKDDDWEDESKWIKANPNLGVSVDLDTLRAKVKKAGETPADIPNIKIKHMNMWISEANAFFDLKKWDECENKNLKLEDMKEIKANGRGAYDLASHVDLTSFVTLFRKSIKTKDDQGREVSKLKYYLFDKTYIPEASLKASRNDIYEDAVKSGNLIVTPGEAINYEFIQEDTLKMIREFKIKECGYDPWNATETAQKLSNKVEMVKVNMNVGNLSEPMTKFDSLIREGDIEHNGSPLLRWCLGNVVAKEDHNGNVFPRKSHTKLKIDPIVAALIALALWLQTEEKESVYSVRGIRTV